MWSLVKQKKNINWIHIKLKKKVKMFYQYIYTNNNINHQPKNNIQYTCTFYVIWYLSVTYTINF